MRVLAVRNPLFAPEEITDFHVADIKLRFYGLSVLKALQGFTPAYATYNRVFRLLL